MEVQRHEEMKSPGAERFQANGPGANQRRWAGSSRLTAPNRPGRLMEGHPTVNRVTGVRPPSGPLCT